MGESNEYVSEFFLTTDFVEGLFARSGTHFQSFGSFICVQALFHQRQTPKNTYFTAWALRVLNFPDPSTRGLVYAWLWVLSVLL